MDVGEVIEEGSVVDVGAGHAPPVWCIEL